MYLQPEAHLPRRIEYLSALRDREDSLFAEYVAELGDALFPDLGQHLVDDEVNEVVRPLFVFDRHGVRAHERRHHVKRGLP